MSAVRTIGLVGGIGSGKTTVASLLEEMGARVIHADAVGHDVYRPNTPGWHALVAAFGEGIIGVGGTIDRKKLGAIVFADHSQLLRLNAIVHPLIGEEIRHRVEALRQQDLRQPIVIEAAILIEAGWLSLVDEVWLVTASSEAVVERLGRQRGLDATEVRRRTAAQMQDDQRRRHAHVVIENIGSLDDLRAQVEGAWVQLLRRQMALFQD